MSEYIGTKVDVLDKGHVTLVDSMGSDSDIVSAARVSYGKGTKTKSSDKSLIRYMMRNWHTSVFEQVVFKFHVKAPIFVFRQWHRHRTQCLSGDTLLHFDLPTPNNGRNEDQLYKQSLKQIFDEFQSIGGKNQDKQKKLYLKKERIQKMQLRSLNETTGEVCHTKIVDIWESGEKDVFTLRTKSGNKVTMSPNHLCFTNKGWLRLRDFSCLNKEKPTWIQNINLSVIGSSKKDGFSLPPVCRTEEICNIEYAGKEMTYDIEVDGPYHNFSANGIIVHNSINELSARYSEMPEEFYVPEKDRIQLQSKTNKQGSGEQIPEALLDHNHKLFYQKPAMTFADYKMKLEDGVSRELARINLPLSTYSEMYTTMNLHNLFHFIHLRMDGHAQYEIRVYANAIFDLIKPIVPIACEAFEDYRINSVQFSKNEIDLIVDALHREGKDDLLQYLEEQGLGSLSKRELSEFKTKIKL